jgi:hypothetical protein
VRDRNYLGYSGRVRECVCEKERVSGSKAGRVRERGRAGGCQNHRVKGYIYREIMRDRERKRKVRDRLAERNGR